MLTFFANTIKSQANLHLKVSELTRTGVRDNERGKRVREKRRDFIAFEYANKNKKSFMRK
ncbi:MAG: hypothetical protein CL959_04070 [Euryarchaeota archaeon]|nr:hypothetical protein [Euryarchaeota archaeon]